MFFVNPFIQQNIPLPTTFEKWRTQQKGAKNRGCLKGCVTEYVNSIKTVQLPLEDPYPTYMFFLIRKQLTCPICLHLLNRPVQLSCDRVVCASCCCQDIQASYSLTCSCCYNHLLSSSTVSRPLTFLLSVLNDQHITCVRKCGKVVKIRRYQVLLAGNCRSHYEDFSSPLKVTLRDVLDKLSSSPATAADMIATHHLVCRVLCQEDGNSGASSIITVPTGGQVSDFSKRSLLP